jgi:hypothetical protein
LGGGGSCRAASLCRPVPSWCSVVPGWGGRFFTTEDTEDTEERRGVEVAEFSEPRKAGKTRKTNLRCLRSVAELRQPLAAVVSPQTSLLWWGVFIAAEGRRKTRKNAVGVWNHGRHGRHGKRPFGRARLLPSRGLVQAGTELVLGGPGVLVLPSWCSVVPGGVWGRAVFRIRGSW